MTGSSLTGRNLLCLFEGIGTIALCKMHARGDYLYFSVVEAKSHREAFEAPKFDVIVTAPFESYMQMDNNRLIIIPANVVAFSDNLRVQNE